MSKSLSAVILLSLFALLSLTSCKEREIRAEGEAYATRSAADQAAADREQARTQVQDIHERDLAVQDWWMDIRTAGTNVAKIMLKVNIVMLGLGLIAVIASTVIAYHKVSVGMANAAVIGAELRANQIMLDVRTRQYPLLRHVHGGRFMLTNPNNNSVIMLDAAQEADRQLIASVAAVQYGGMLAYEARHASEDAALAISNIPQLQNDVPDPARLDAASDYETKRLENSR